MKKSVDNEKIIDKENGIDSEILNSRKLFTVNAIFHCKTGIFHCQRKWREILYSLFWVRKFPKFQFS